MSAAGLEVGATTVADRATPRRRLTVSSAMGMASAARLKKSRPAT